MQPVACIGIENGYSLGTDVARVKEFFDRGGRYMLGGANERVVRPRPGSREARATGRTTSK